MATPSAPTAIRQNNALQQQNGVGELRLTGPEGGAYLNLSADNQYLGFPGGRLVTPTFSLVDSDPRGAATPFDYGDKQGLNGTMGVTRMLAPGTELIVDGGIRQKKQQAGFFSRWVRGRRQVHRHHAHDLFGDAAPGQQSQPRRYAGKADRGHRRLRRRLRI